MIHEKSNTPVKRADPKTIQELLLENAQRKERINTRNNSIIYKLAEFFHEANRVLIEDYPEMMISKLVKRKFITWDKLTEEQRQGAMIKAEYIFEQQDVMAQIFNGC